MRAAQVSTEAAGNVRRLNVTVLAVVLLAHVTTVIVVLQVINAMALANLYVLQEHIPPVDYHHVLRALLVNTTPTLEVRQISLVLNAPPVNTTLTLEVHLVLNALPVNTISILEVRQRSPVLNAPPVNTTPILEVRQRSLVLHAPPVNTISMLEVRQRSLATVVQQAPSLIVQVHHHAATAQ